MDRLDDIIELADWQDGCGACYVQVAVDALNLREGPSLAAGWLATWQRGDILVAFCRSGPWLLVEERLFRGRLIGWSHSDHVQRIEVRGAHGAHMQRVRGDLSRLGLSAVPSPQQPPAAPAADQR